MSAPLPPGFFARPVAHRGLHDRAAGRIENTLSAIRAAAEAGYAIEIDVQLSADGAAMVFHDDTLDRLTAGTGLVRARSAAELARIAVTGGGDTIPTLPEVLAAVAGLVPLVVEIKDQGGRMSAEGVGPLEAAAAAALAGYRGPAAVMSFNPASMAEMARLAPALPRGLVACAAEAWDDGALPQDRLAALARLDAFDAVGAAFASYHWRDLPTPATVRLRAGGAPVICWTVRSAADAAAAMAHSDAVTFEGFRPAA
jgi:glycerophosphoryl diester phosphodiesterase